MSAFLGPIHYWLYNKIQIQQNIVGEIVSLGKTLIPDLEKQLDENYESSETRPLEEIIDTDNIHGWLQTRVTQAEYKLAYSVTMLLKKSPELLEDITSVFYEKGKAISIANTNAAEAYKGISDSLLDGMPCDHANTVLEESEEKVIWKRNTCVHKSYWEEIGGDINLYYSLREAFIRGYLSGLALVYEKIDENTNMIKRSDVHE